MISQCSNGIDFAKEDELIAANATVEEVREHIGATSLAYISLDALQAATDRSAASVCRACLTRVYPTHVPAGAAAAKMKFEVTPV